MFASDPPKEFDCLQSVGLPAEAALNDYVKAAKTWSACFDDANCSNASVKPKLQARWDKAATQVRRANAGLVRMARSTS